MPREKEEERAKNRRDQPTQQKVECCDMAMARRKKYVNTYT